ncbi:MAG: pro-sigmaK processing inhibitor BofA family protein [Methanoregula sp.]|nr:pro-sigmaK processing inhibitor BofA family protein [Methanoregula sp.]
MSAVLIAILLVVAIVAIVYYLAKKFVVLVVNAILGIILLFILNFLHVMQWMGKPDLGYDIATVLVSAIGGLPGVCILVLLDILGITL